MEQKNAKNIEKLNDKKKETSAKFKKEVQLSDTGSNNDKTSELLFNTSGNGIEWSRVKELPNSFYNDYGNLEGNLSASSTDNNGNSSFTTTGSSGKNVLKRCYNSTYSEVIQSKPTSRTLACHASSTKTPSAVSVLTLSSMKQRRAEQEVIDEMNRQYDHNLCLERFISEMEEMQQKQKETAQSKKTVDRNSSPSNSSLSSSGSSNLPQSNEDTDSGSRNSESINSSNSDNTKGEKEDTRISKKSADKSSTSETKKKIAVQKPSKSVTFPAVPSSSKVSSSESGIDISGNKSSSEFLNDFQKPGESEPHKNYKGGKLGRKRKRGYIYDPKPVIKKPPKRFVPSEKKDQSYWDKRERNNEAARKSREMRRLKEKETNDKLLRLKKENEALRVAITLLIQRNENLEEIIEELEKKDSLTQIPATVAITC